MSPDELLVGACRTCGASRTGCDRSRELRGRPCCHLCAHIHDTTGTDLGSGSEPW